MRTVQSVYIIQQEANTCNRNQCNVSKYKKVADKKQPVSLSVPQDYTPGAQYIPIQLPLHKPLPISPPKIALHPLNGRITQERLNLILANAAKGYSPKEMDLLVYILLRHESAIAFNNSKRGLFKEKYYPPYVMKTVEHNAWAQQPHPLPQALIPEMIKMLNAQVAAGNLEGLDSPYHCGGEKYGASPYSTHPMYTCTQSNKHRIDAVINPAHNGLLNSKLREPRDEFGTRN